MKFVSAALSLVGLRAAKAVPLGSLLVSKVLDLDAEIVAATPVSEVDISVKCGDVDYFVDLSPAELGFAGKSLEDSFNELHMTIDGVSLIDLKYEGPGDETLLGYSGSWWKGGFRCDNCRRDLLEDSFTKDPKWEQLFNSKLKESDAFAGSEQCTIRMKKAGSQTVAVDIAVKCSGINFSQVTLEDESFVGQVLKTSFDECHYNDAELLTDLQFEGVKHTDEDASSDGTNLRGYSGSSWRGGWRCDNCKRGALKAVDKKQLCWNDLFLAKLRTNDVFDSAKKCWIAWSQASMEAKEA